jgi:hypothetical protein
LKLLIGDLRPLEADFRRQALKGRPPPALAVALAVESVERIRALFPEHVEVIASRLPWLERRRTKARPAA